MANSTARARTLDRDPVWQDLETPSSRLFVPTMARVDGTDALAPAPAGMTLGLLAVTQPQRKLFADDPEPAGAIAPTRAASPVTVPFAPTEPVPVHAESAPETLEFSRDPLVSDQWGLSAIDAERARDILAGANGSPMAVQVAVIDTGIDLGHPDLSANIWRNRTEVFGTPGVDDDGNGYTDDYHGYDFARRDNNPEDDNNHGTHVAGIIGADGANNIGTAGAAGLNVELMALKALDGSGGGSIATIAEAVYYAVDNGADIINLSLGTSGFSHSLYNAIAYAASRDVLVVAAAGNAGDNSDRYPFYPAAFSLDNIVSVAATTPDNRLASFSNYGDRHVDLGAPGTNILSTLPGGGYGSLSGTSMAAPLVTGVAAALLSEFDDTIAAGERVEFLTETLLDTAMPASDLAGKTATGGVLDFAEAAAAASGAVATVASAIAEVGTLTLSDRSQTVRFSDRYENPVVFVQGLSSEDNQPANARITNIADSSFTVLIEEPNYLDGRHANERVSYFVFEAGSWELADGTRLEVGTLQSDRLTSAGFERVGLDGFATAPAVMTQVQTDNGSDFVATRQQRVAATGFEVAMQEEQARKDDFHVTETIGYLAMSRGNGIWDGRPYQVGSSGDAIADDFREVFFAPGLFGSTPNLLAGVASYNDPDPVVPRYRNLNAAGVELRVQEEQSADAEVSHGFENLHLLAIEGSGPLTAFAV